MALNCPSLLHTFHCNRYTCSQDTPWAAQVLLCYAKIVSPRLLGDSS